MKWFKEWFDKRCQESWNRDQHLRNSKRSYNSGTAIAEIDSPEGENNIRFELSTAIGGRILNVRRYDNRKDQHDTQTYIIPNGEDIGERVAKIVNLEMFK